MKTPRIAAVEPLPEYRLLVIFDNGRQRIYDCTPLLERNAFRLLRVPALFRAVTVDPGGYGVSWNDEADLAESELWCNGLDPTADAISTKASTSL